MRKDLEFKDGVGVLLKSWKPTPYFIGPFQILKRVGPVTYQIALPRSLSNLHNVFHVSQLHKYILDPSLMIELDDIQVKENLTSETLPLRIDEKWTKHLRGKKIPLFKVVWGVASEEDATWELESQTRKAYLALFELGKFHGWNF